MRFTEKIFNRLGYEKKEQTSAKIEELKLIYERMYYTVGNNLLGYYKHWVYTCVNKIARQVSSYPFKLYTMKRQGKHLRGGVLKSFVKANKEQLKSAEIDKVEIDNHPFLDLINDPNDITTRRALIEHIMINLELDGYTALYLPKGNLNLPFQCWYLPLTNSGIITPIVKNNTIESFTYQDGTTSLTIPADEIIYINYPHPKNPFYGMSPILSQTYPYDIDDYLSKHIYSIFKNGATFGNHFTTDQQLKGKQVDDLKELINSQYQGALNAGKPIFTHSGLKLDNTPLKSPLSDLAIEQITTYARDKIITSYDMPPEKLLPKNINRATMEVVDSMFITDCILPKVNFIEEYIQRYIQKTYDTALILEIVVPIPKDKQFDLQERQINLSTAYTTVNEERAKEGREPVEWGDVPLVPFSLAPLSEKQQTASFPVSEKKSFQRPKKRIWKFKDHSNTMKKLLQSPWEKAMKQYFEQEYNTLQKKLNSHGKSIQETLKGWNINKKSKWIKDNIKQLDDINISPVEEEKRLIEIARGLFYHCFTEYGNAKLKLFGINEPYEVSNPKAESWLSSRLRKFSKEITGVTFDEVQSILREGFKEGQSIYEIGKTLREKFESYDKYRAMTIAQTEVNSACSFSELDAMQQKGLDSKLMKFWINEYNARDTHIQAGKDYNENNAITLDEDFNIGADIMQAPGMGTLPEENISCRCNLAYVEIT